MACKACGGVGHNRATCGRASERPVKPKPSMDEVNRKKDERLEVRFPGMLDRIGKESDVELARSYNITRAYVQMIRKRRGNESHLAGRKVDYDRKLDKLEAAGIIGSKPDKVVAREHGIPIYHVAERRNKLGLPRFRGLQNSILDGVRDRVGVESDCALSEELGISVTTIYGYRLRHGIPSSLTNLERKKKVSVGRTQYPWEKWVDGEEHLIEKGKDFTCGLWSMSSRIRGEAASRGRRVNVRIDMKDKKISLRFLPVETV